MSYNLDPAHQTTCSRPGPNNLPVAARPGRKISPADSGRLISADGAAARKQGYPTLPSYEGRRETRALTVAC